MDKPKVLFSIPTKHHVEIALDEITGLRKMGYLCGQFNYAAKDGFNTKFERLWIIIINALNLIKIARNFKPDIIYFNSRLEVIAGIRDFITIIIFKTFYFKKIRFIIKSHGSDIEVLENQSLIFRRIILPFLKKIISAWLFLSTQEKDNIIKAGYFPSDKIYVTKNIVRTFQFKRNVKFKDNLKIPDDDKIVLFVGRIITQKGIYEVLDAFTKIKDKFELTLVIVGDGPEYENVRRISKSRGIENKVIFTGFIPEPRVTEFYANCDILVFPTFFPEGFPMALFNSVAAGMSIITTPTRASVDYLVDPENCLWVEPKNSVSVYNALNTLLESKTLITDMRFNNLQKAKLFSEEQVCAELSELLQSVYKQ